MIRAALAVTATLSASGAAAETLLDALSGDWALMRDSQASTDAENITAAREVCATGVGVREVITLAATGETLIMNTVDNSGATIEYLFDPEVSGGKLADGRLALNFSVDGERSHDLIYWKTTIEGDAFDLLEVQGPPNPAGLYMKCP